MFCSECGRKATGKFCSNCGSKLTGGSAAVEAPLVEAWPADWSDVVEYEALLRIPEVRDSIARCAVEAKKPISGEQILDMYGKALGALTGVSLPMSTVARFSQSFYSKLGVETGKELKRFIAEPTGTLIVRLLCLLAQRGRTLRSAHQLSGGCILVAALPSDLFALEGNLVLNVSRRPGGTQVDARTEIRGQMFDWGKSARCLEELFRELTATAGPARAAG